jgi:tRNA threonylcarbamoyl adenosine modification protein YeaZ
MILSHKAYIALDCSSEIAVVAAFYGEKLLFESALNKKMSHASEITQAVGHAEESIQKAGCELQAVFVGLGPGSFIGLRIALATALGYSMAKDLPLMGFCSHRALMYSHSKPHVKTALVTKASGNLCYFSLFEGIKQSIELLDVHEISQRLESLNLVLSDTDLELSLPLKIIKGPNANGILQALVERLSHDNFADEKDFIKPNYIKEATVSQPKKSPVIARLLW